MIWQPLDLSAQCPPNSQLNACSSFGYTFLNLLVQLYGGPIDSGKETPEGGSYDFIVVGAGAAGAVVANRLSAVTHWKVLLLEAGGEQPAVTTVPALSTALLGSSIDWQYRVQPDDRSCLAIPGGCPWPRGKVMGGSSSVNSFVYVRGNRLDYDDWAAAGNDGWSYDDVLPYFIKSERNLNAARLDPGYHGVSGDQSVSFFPYTDEPSRMLTEAAHEAGLPIRDFNGFSQEGTMQAQSVSENGQRDSTYTAFIAPIRQTRKNLVVKPDSEVIKVLVDENDKAYGVVYVRNGELHEAYASKEVIISAGAIASPKLLLLSGIGPKEHLDDVGIAVVKDLPVGENLQDHPTFSGIIIVLPNATATAVSNQEIVDELYEYRDQKIKRGPYSGNGPVNSVSFLRTDPSLPAPDLQIQVNNGNWREMLSDPERAINVATLPSAFYDAVIPRPMNLVPKSRGKVLLNKTDPHGDPLIYANYLKDPEDIIPILKGIRFILSWEQTDAFKSRGAEFLRVPLKGCEDYTWGTDEYFVCLMRSYTSSTYHPSGSVKMGPKWDPGAVVDPRLRVYGISGLRVIDASIMPVVVRGNTNAPSIMIGERGVALVLEDWLHNYNSE